MFFYTTALTVINKFPSNLAHSVSDKCGKNYPLYLMYIDSISCKVTSQNCDKNLTFSANQNSSKSYQKPWKVNVLCNLLHSDRGESVFINSFTPTVRIFRLSIYESRALVWPLSSCTCVVSLHLVSICTISLKVTTVKTDTNLTFLLAKTQGLRWNQFSICLSTSFVYVVTLNVQWSPLVLTHVLT